MNKTLPGINIQFPISQFILNERKTIETREYPLPEKYLNQEMYMIETPGKTGNFKARIVAIVKFIDCFLYQNEKQFYADFKRHLVKKDSQWKWRNKKKWGWELILVENFQKEFIFTGKKGIIFTKNVSLPPINAKNIK